LLELVQHAEKLELMLIGRAGSQRHCNEIAQYAGPEHVDKLRVAVEQQDNFTAGSRPARLKMMEQAQRARMQFAERQRALVVFAFDVMEAAGAGPALDQRVVQSCKFHGRRISGNMYMPRLLRRLTWHSSSSGCFGR